MVRDPIKTAVAAYLEVASVRTLFERSKRYPEGLRSTPMPAVLDGRIACRRDCGPAGAGNHSGGRRSLDRGGTRRHCVHPNEKMHAWLDEIEASNPLGGEFFHAYPQALKLNVIRPSSDTGVRFDALVRLEKFTEGMHEISRRANVTMRLRPGKKKEVHTTSGDACGDLDLSDPRLLRRLCALYQADFVCFNYERPEACRQL